MVAAAVGIQVRNWKPFASTFAAFFSRAYDFIRMAAISRANMALAGSHAGVSIGEDGPSQMALEDLAMMRAVSGSTVLYPCDANQTAKLVANMAELEGISYLRTTRAATPVMYSPDEDFVVGGSRVLRSSDEDDVAIVGAGITVVDCYSVKPIDAEGLRDAAAGTGALVTVEDHWPEGGLGEAVLSALADLDEKPAIARLAVAGMPGSGKPAELLAAAGIDSEHIADAARRLVRARALR
jgi:transketolase